MKHLWVGALGLSLGCWLAAAAADEPRWLPVNPAAAPAQTAAATGVTLGRPVASLGRPVAAVDSPVSLGRPQTGDSGIVLASFSQPAPTSSRTIVRMQSGESASRFADEPWASSPASSGDSLFATAHYAAELPEVAPTPKPVSGPVHSKPLEQPIHAFNGDGQNTCCNDLDCACDECRGRQPGRFYGSGEYLMWWIRDYKTPPLVTTSAPGTPSAQAGILGFGTTSILLNDDIGSYSMFNGVRFTLGYWFDPCQTKAIEASFFGLAQRSNDFSTNSDAHQVIARPFFSQNRGTEFSEVTTFPGLSMGGIAVSSRSQLWGAEANYRCNVCSNCYMRWDVLAGARYLNLEEDLRITENVQVLPGVPVFGGDHVIVQDRFATRNQFYGGQLGTVLGFNYNRWSLDLKGKVALGDVHQSIDVSGSQTLFLPNGTVQTFRGGLLALPSNIGHFSRDRFAVVPELGINIGYQVTDHLKAFVGYTLLYWSSVVRPGDQIDRVLDERQIPNFFIPGQPLPPPVKGASRPLLPFKESDFWAHGVNVGLEFTY